MLEQFFDKKLIEQSYFEGVELDITGRDFTAFRAYLDNGGQCTTYFTHGIGCFEPIGVYIEDAKLVRYEVIT